MELKEFFDEYNIEYWDSGKNVTSGWINIQCPFCDDDSNHLGIRPSDLTCNCWKCGRKTMIGIIKELLGISYREAKDIFKRIETKFVVPIISKEENRKLGKSDNFVVLPDEATRIFPKLHKQYLKKRRYDYKKLMRKYKIQAVYNFGKYAFRVIIPIFKNKELVSFTSRDVTGYAKIPYLHASKRECLIRPKDLIYGYDEIPKGGDAVLVEGVFDKWRLGDGAICSFGTMVSGKQLVELSSMKINNLYILFDSDKPGKIAAKQLAKIVAPIAKSVEIINVIKHKGDPDNLSKEKAELLMRSLGLRR